MLYITLCPPDPQFVSPCSWEPWYTVHFHEHQKLGGAGWAWGVLSVCIAVSLDLRTGAHAYQMNKSISIKKFYLFLQWSVFLFIYSYKCSLTLKCVLLKSRSVQCKNKEHSPNVNINLRERVWAGLILFLRIQTRCSWAPYQVGGKSRTLPRIFENPKCYEIKRPFLTRILMFCSVTDCTWVSILDCPSLIFPNLMTSASLGWKDCYPSPIGYAWQTRWSTISFCQHSGLACRLSTSFNTIHHPWVPTD